MHHEHVSTTTTTTATTTTKALVRELPWIHWCKAMCGLLFVRSPPKTSGTMKCPTYSSEQRRPKLSWKVKCFSCVCTFLFFLWDAARSAQDQFKFWPVSILCSLDWKDYNAVSETPMHLILFDFAISHLARIVRVLLMPGGHGLLVGMGTATCTVGCYCCCC